MDVLMLKPYLKMLFGAENYFLTLDTKKQVTAQANAGELVLTKMVIVQ